MNLEKAIEIGSDIDMLPWFTLPLASIKTDIGNGFIAWHDHETKSGAPALFVTEKKGKRNLTILTVVGCPKHGTKPYWKLARSALSPDRLGELVQLLFGVAARIRMPELEEVEEEEDDEPDCESRAPDQESRSSSSTAHSSS